jgi:uncharacterized RDD family membrane protein YckC
MTNEARSQFLKLIDHYGNDIYNDPPLFKSLLNDYFKGKYKSERNVLVGSISAGVPERFLKSQGSIAYPTLRSQCIDLIQQEGFESKLAQWAVDSWAIGFNIIKKTDADVITGRISITSIQSEVKVYLDGNFRGKTPLNLSAISVGTHTLKCTLDGYQDRKKSIEVIFGELTEVIVKLHQLPQNIVPGPEPVIPSKTSTIAVTPLTINVPIQSEGTGIRFVARVADYFCCWVIAILVAGILITIPPMNIILTYVILLFYDFGFLITMSTTPGKKIVGLKIVSMAGTSITGRQAMMRGLGVIIPFALISPFFYKDRRGWHDRIANTVVVKK